MKIKLVDLKEARARVDAMNEVDRENGKEIMEEKDLRHCLLTCRGALAAAIINRNWDYVEEAYVMMERSGV